MVSIDSGRYELDEPLHFNSEDSGTAEHSITYRGDSSSGKIGVTLSGGSKLTDWQQVSDGIWKVKAPGKQDIRQLFRAGQRLPRAVSYIETPEDIANRVRAALKNAPPERLSFAPDCGLRQTARWAAKQKLANMVAAVNRVREELEV